MTQRFPAWQLDPKWREVTYREVENLSLMLLPFLSSLVFI